MMKDKFLLLISALFLSASLSAQESTIKPKNHCIGIVPQYAFINGLRTDFDFRIKKNHPAWLVLAPQLYLSPHNPDLYDYDSMWGMGLELQHRYYFNSINTLPKGFYFGYGPMFQYFSMSYRQYYSEIVTENGTEYYVIKNGVVATGIYKVGLTFSAGYQALVLNTLYFDFYLGTGLRLSFDSRPPSGLTRNFNDWWGGYGYSGTLLTFGMRFGMAY